MSIVVSDAPNAKKSSVTIAMILASGMGVVVIGGKRRNNVVYKTNIEPRRIPCRL
jgi:hypothetical protein